MPNSNTFNSSAWQKNEGKSAGKVRIDKYKSSCVKGQTVLVTTEFRRSWFCSELYLTCIPNICVVKGLFINMSILCFQIWSEHVQIKSWFHKEPLWCWGLTLVLVVFPRETQKGTLLLQSHQISNQVFISSRNFSRESSVTKLLRFLAFKWGMGMSMFCWEKLVFCPCAAQFSCSSAFLSFTKSVSYTHFKVGHKN